MPQWTDFVRVARRTAARWAGRLRTAARSRPAAWAVGGALAAGALGQARAEGVLTVLMGAAVVAATLPLAWYRSRPAAAGYAAAAGAAVYAVLDVVQQDRVEPDVVQGTQSSVQPAALLAPVAGGLIGLYLLARHGRARARWLLLLGAAVPLANVFGSRYDLAGLVLLSVVLAIVALDAAQSRAELHRERAAALARSIADQRREAAVAERAEIARELHDLVAHAVSVIAVRAELLPPTVPGLPEPARAGFEEIARTARSAMTELRQMLGVLRDGRDAAELVPPPTLDRLPELADRHRAAGGRVRLHVGGRPRPLPALVELSAYRVVQEALTNVLKHAPGADACVHVAHGPDRLTVRITDTGPAVSAARADPYGGGGHGLTGMRERVGMLGGRLRAGPAPGGGFEVNAELPLPPRPEGPPRPPGAEG